MLRLKDVLKIAGLAQIALAVASLAIPYRLNWQPQLKSVQPLIRQMFWVYAGYILVINLCFGLISFFNAAELLSGANLAKLLTGFMAAYWISRVLIQFFYFDRSNFPPGKLNSMFEIILTALFVCLSIIYGTICFFNYQQH